MREETAVGDLNSDEAGSGARKNAGKDPLEFVPARYWLDVWRDDAEAQLREVLRCLAHWQERREPISLAFGFISQTDYVEAAKVFEFGAGEYKPWNWAKGMAWSVPVGCILRHMRAIMRGENIDPGSGLLHWGHVVCNLIMLDWYSVYYTEGDDRPPIFNVGVT